MNLKGGYRMKKTYLEKIFYASLEATGGNKRRAKDLIVDRAMKDDIISKALAVNQLVEIVDLSFSEYYQAKTKPANQPKLNDKELDPVAAQINANKDVKASSTLESPHWRVASSNLVVMRNDQKNLSKKELDHMLDHYF